MALNGSNFHSPDWGEVSRLLNGQVRDCVGDSGRGLLHNLADQITARQAALLWLDCMDIGLNFAWRTAIRGNHIERSGHFETATLFLREIRQIAFGQGTGRSTFDRAFTRMAELSQSKEANPGITRTRLRRLLSDLRHVAGAAQMRVHFGDQSISPTQVEILSLVDELQNDLHHALTHFSEDSSQRDLLAQLFECDSADLPNSPTTMKTLASPLCWPTLLLRLDDLIGRGVVIPRSRQGKKSPKKTSHTRSGRSRLNNHDVWRPETVRKYLSQLHQELPTITLDQATQALGNQQLADYQATGEESLLEEIRADTVPAAGNVFFLSPRNDLAGDWQQPLLDRCMESLPTWQRLAIQRDLCHDPEEEYAWVASLTSDELDGIRPIKGLIRQKDLMARAGLPNNRLKYLNEVQQAREKLIERIKTEALSTIGANRE